MTRTSEIWTAGILGAIFIVYFSFSYMVVYEGDDWNFMADYIWLNGSGDMTWEGFWKNFHFVRWSDNGRWTCTMLQVPSVALLPRWLMSAIAGLSMCVIIYAGTVLTVRDRSIRPEMMVMMWAVMTFTFQWRGDIMNNCTVQNSLLASAITVLFMLVITSRSLLAGHIGRWQIILMIPAAFVAGAVHEGDSIPVCAGIGAIAVMSRFRLPAGWWITALSYSAGLLHAISARGIWARLSTPVAQANEGGSLNIPALIQMNLPVILFCALLIMSLSTRRNRHQLALAAANTRFRVLSVITLASAVLTLMSEPANPRAMWITSLFCMLTAFKILEPWSRTPIFKRLYRPCSTIAIVLILMFYTGVLRTQYFIWHENREIMAAIENSENGTIYRDYDFSMPKTTLFHPVGQNWVKDFKLNTYHRMQPQGRVAAVLPKALEGFDAAEASAVDGNAGLIQFNGQLVAPDKEMRMEFFDGRKFEAIAENTAYDIECVDGSIYEGMPAVKIRFISPSGTPYLYVRPLYMKVKGPYRKVNAVSCP